VEAVAPGFGVPGITGILCFTASIILAAPSLQTGVQSFLIALVGAVVLIILAVRFLGRSKYWDRLSLQLSQGKEGGYISQKEDSTIYIGRKGRTATPLRPAGIVRLDDGKRLDVVSEGGFIERDRAVTVTGADGPRIVVAPDP